MSGDAVGLFGKACRLFSCLTGANEYPAGAGAHGNGASPKAPGLPAAHLRSNSYAAATQGAAMTTVLRHNPIDVCLTSGEVSVLQGNPSQRTFEASWCGVPVHLHVLTFVKRPNPIAQLPGPTSSHATVAAALDAPPPAQANMLTQPDMIAVATEVEAALVQLIAEPSPQVLPVLACAKVTCRAHIGSPGDEHVTQRIVAEVHIVTPRVPGLVSLSQWLQQRWPQCELNTPATATDSNNHNGGATGGGGAAAALPAPPAPPAADHRLASAGAPTPGAPGAAPTAAAGAPGAPAHSTAATAAAVGPGRRQAAGLTSVPGTMPSRLGVSQPIAEGLAPRDIGALGGSGLGQHGRYVGDAAATAAMATARASGAETDASEGGAPVCIPCLALLFAPSPTPPQPPSAAVFGPGVASGGGRPSPGQQQQPPPAPPANPGRTDPGTASAAPGAAGAAAGLAVVPATTGGAATGEAGNGTRRLAAPAPTGLGLGRAPRFPLPPPPPRAPKLPVPEALELLICLAEALRNLHRRGLTHGSLTPRTIQLQLVEPEAAVAAAAAVAASATAAVPTTAGPAAGGQLPTPQGSPQGSCPAAQPTPSSLPVAPSPQSQPRTPDPAPDQLQGQRAGENPEGALRSAACGLAAASPLLNAGADTGTAVTGPCAPGSPAAAAVVPAAAAAASPPSAKAESECSQPGVSEMAADGAAPGVEAAIKAAESAPAATDDPAQPAAPNNGAGGTAAAAPVPEGCSGAAAAAATELAGGASPCSVEAPKASASPPPSTGADTGKSTPAAASGGGGGDGATDAALQQPVAPVAPAPSPQQQRMKSMQSLRRRGAGAGGGTIRALLPLPAVGPALLQMQTWGRARPVGLPREHLLWCAPELLNAGGLGWGPPLLARRSGNGSATVAGTMGLMGLGPLDQSIGCRGGNRMGRGGSHHHHHHHSRHFGDGSYGGSIGGVGGGGGGNSRRYRLASSLLMGQDPGAAGASANGITPSCDVYSLGMLMWYLVSGQSPFQHLPNQDQVLRIKEMGFLDEQLPFSTEMPSGYVQLARRCWAPLPMQRPTMNVVLSEMRALRAHLLGLPGQREQAGFGGGGGGEHGYGYGGSSMGEMTGDSRLSFTLSLPLSSRDLSNGEEYALARPPLELAFGAGDAPGAGGDGAGGGTAAAGVSTGGSGHAPPPPLKASLPAALLTALTAPRRGSAGGGGGGLMDDDDNYSDTDRFTEAHTTEHTEVSGGGTPYSSPPTAGTTRGASVGGASARLRAAAAAAAFASTARSFRLVRAGHRPGSTAGSVGRSGSSIPAALLAANGSRRGGGASVHSPGPWGGGGDDGNAPVVGAQPHPSAAAGAGVGLSIGRVPSALAAAAGSLRARCASSSSLVNMSSTPPPPALAALRFSHTPVSGGGGGGGSCCPRGSIATAGDDHYSSAGSPGGGAASGGAAAGSSGGGGGGCAAAAAAASSSGRGSGMVSATSASLGCLAVPCGNGSGGSND